MWRFLWLTCLRVGFWCQQLWFGFWCPNWLCRTTNQAQLCEFLTRASWLDFCLNDHFDHSFVVFKKCTTETHLGKRVRRWWRGPHATIDQHLVFLGGERGWVGLLVREHFPAAGLVGGWVLFDERSTSITTFHKSRGSNPSIRSPASNEMISDSVELWDTGVCF